MNILLYIILALMTASLYRLLRGPSLEDRILSLNIFAVMVIILIAWYAIVYEQSFYLDIAIVYSLLSFSEVLAFVKFSGRSRD